MKIDSQTDCHMHTRFSDGTGSVEDMAVSAIEKGLTRICITDHMPLPVKRRYSMDKQKLDAYRLCVRNAQKKYQDKIDIWLGMEMEFIPEYRFWMQSIQDRGWQCSIASVHSLMIENDPFMVNGNLAEFEKLIKRTGYNIHALLKMYYKTVQAAADTGWFDIAGHLDVVKKHNVNERYFNESDLFYQTLVRETLEAILRNNMKMEINLSGQTHPVRAAYPSNWIIREAMEMGIEVILGSDAHCPEDIGRYFDTISQYRAAKIKAVR